MKYEIKDDLREILAKLRRKDKVAHDRINRKIEEIVNSDPEHYKNLRHDLKNVKSVHIMKSFVLVFSYDKANESITFLDYDHHDVIYKKRFV
ncbi:MAG TPA: addiction module toxin RelE [Nanoarchaeota archaeon]|nr:addiction module toxin RelE [Candidatus Pacearchaeota archaeon]HIH17731.1 addiction module toxin RelE [Nanoarchaeota archaeon]HIH33795.1 addiction module toxin RelE [Nanoarchaeota archaeon]HIH51626.1 addiction module toxin RelE [Nanoarchaeota archaeon]HIH65691.1 addiction module toxin RelE [Nanoarchaeota archaeon]